jgi:hypothetical protein
LDFNKLRVRKAWGSRKGGYLGRVEIWIGWELDRVGVWKELVLERVGFWKDWDSRKSRVPEKVDPGKIGVLERVNFWKG